jgi:penicillin amidase
MNRARDAAEFKRALRDFHTPQQNVVFADTAGTIGFVAAGRVPVRRNIANESLFPAPGWIDDYVWTGTLPFTDLPQIENPPDGTIVTANNDIRPARYFKFLGRSFDRPYRRDRIRTLLAELPAATLEDMQRIQLDAFSAPVFGFVRSYLREVAPSVPIDIAAAMSSWDGRMAPDRPEPLIATAWLYATAQRVLADELGQEHFRGWWLWQVDILRDVMADPRWCDDRDTPTAENCRDALRASLAKALDTLRERYGADWKAWSWGAAHQVQFRHPVFANLPHIGGRLVPKVAAPGDHFTINRGGMMVSEDGGRFSDVHGPGMRMAVDMSHPGAPVFNLAGGQSGHPLSSHYSDLLPEWAEGSYRTFQNPAEDVLILRPQQIRPANAEETKP